MTGDATLGEAHMADDAGLPATPRFAVVLRGYDRRQVDEHVERLQRVFARMRADLDTARSQSPVAAGPVPRVAPRPRPGVPEGDQIGSFTDRMQSILAEAEAEAAEIRRNAQQAARAETEGVRAQLADLIRQRDAVLAELTRMRGQLEGMLAAPTASMPARFGPGYRPGPPPGPDRLHGPAPVGPAGPLAGAPFGAPPGPVPPPVPTRAGAAPSGAAPRTPEAAQRSDGAPRTGSGGAPPPPPPKDGFGHALRPPGPGDGEGPALRPGADDSPRGSRSDTPAARPVGEAHEGRSAGRPGERRPVPAGAHADPDDLDSRRSAGASTPPVKPDVAGSEALAAASASAAAGRAPQSGADRAGSGPGASGPGAPDGSGPKPDTADRGPGREVPAGAPASGSGSSRAGADTASRRDPGKPAHRLPSGAYPAVPSRPPGRSAPEPEPAELFRAPAVAEPRSTPESRPGEPRAATGPERPGGRGGVQPADPTVLAEVPGRSGPGPDRA